MSIWHISAKLSSHPNKVIRTLKWGFCISLYHLEWYRTKASADYVSVFIMVQHNTAIRRSIRCDPDFNLPPSSHLSQISSPGIWKSVSATYPLDIEGCICHFTKGQIHSFISEGRILSRYSLQVWGLLHQVLYLADRQQGDGFQSLQLSFGRRHLGGVFCVERVIQLDVWHRLHSLYPLLSGLHCDVKIGRVVTVDDTVCVALDHLDGLDVFGFVFYVIVSWLHYS